MIVHSAKKGKGWGVAQFQVKFSKWLKTLQGVGENWHGHVTAVTVGPEYRRLGTEKYFFL